MGLGKSIFFAVSACLLWSQVFVLPMIFNEIPVLWLTWGRCAIYGCISLVIIATQYRRMRTLFSWSLAKHLLLLALVANILHYLALVMGLRYADPALATLILSLNPITVSLYSNFRERSFSMRKLFFPISAIGIGLMFLYVPLLQGQYSKYDLIMASFYGLLALGSWTWFIVQNNRLFEFYEKINAQDWVSLLGLATGAWVLVITIFYSILKDRLPLQNSWGGEISLAAWLGASIILGVGSSWLANYFWNKASIHLSLTLGVLLTVLEGLFGLAFILAWQRAMPLLMDLIGAAFIFIGIIFAVYLLRKKEKVHV